jgi:hypothetical protein
MVDCGCVCKGGGGGGIGVVNISVSFFDVAWRDDSDLYEYFTVFSCVLSFRSKATLETELMEMMKGNAP